MKYLQITVREPAEQRNPMHTFLIRHDEVQLAQLLNWNTTDDDLDVMLFRIVGERAPYTAALEQSSFVVEYETAQIDEESFYVYIEHETRAEDSAFRDPFLERRVLTVPPIEFISDGETSVEIVGRAADLQAVLDDFPSEFDVRVDQIGDYDRGLTAFTSLLTDRQREAVSVAVGLGYYDVPRTASVEDVAAALDCAPSTASNHLRKAQARLARQVVAD